MACPTDENNGFIQITDPITLSNLNTIVVDTYPFTISFAPRTILPTLSGNQIIESNVTENTCIYRGNRFQLINVQICSVLHKGYVVPSQNMNPEMELVLTFQGRSSTTNPYAGMIVSVPIYQTNSPSRSEYITQLVSDSAPSCKYNNQLGYQYTGDSYQTISDSTLNKCVQYCCNDINCLSYNFQKNTCSLQNSIPPIKNTGDTTMVAGTVNHSVLNPVGSCSLSNTKDKGTTGTTGTRTNDVTGVKVATLESIFSSNDAQKQTSFSYKTCFEVIDFEQNIRSKNLAVFVFPYGIQVTSATLELLKLKLNYKLPTYAIPGELREDKGTLFSYRVGSSGDKTFTKMDISKTGNVYTTKISSCSNEFKNRFEYFTESPRLPKPSVSGLSATSATSATSGVSDETTASTYYKTSQYKCVPFDQRADLSGNYVIPGNKTLDTILNEQKQVEEKQKKGDSSTKSMTTDDIENYVAMAIGGTIVLAVFVRFAISLSSKDA